jgi:transglutaminase-like putative cysteine protease
VRANQPVSERRQYQLTSYTEYTTAGLDARARNLQLPEDYSPRAKQLASTWQLQSGGDAATIVNAALQYFNGNSFYYTLSPPPLVGNDPVGQFLFDSRRGYCEHYAGAFTGLMRAAGVPARVVTGYQGGELNPQGGYFIITQADAHAWAEVWLDGRGWVRVDPTGAVAPERIEYGAAALRRMLSEGATPGQLSQSDLRRIIELDWVARALRQARLTWDLVNQGWNEWFLQFDRESQFDLLRLIGFRTPTWVQLAGVLVSGVLLFTLLFAAVVLWRRRPVDPVLRAYRTFCARLARAGVARAPGEGPLDYARRAALALPALRPDIEHFTGLYVNLRYGDAAAAPQQQELIARLRRFRPRG